MCEHLNLPRKAISLSNYTPGEQRIGVMHASCDDYDLNLYSRILAAKGSRRPWR